MNKIGLETVGAKCEKPQKKVPAMLCHQYKGLSSLHEIISKLDANLTPVLTQEPCDPVSKPEGIPETNMVGEALEMNNRSLDFAISRLERIIDMLEV